MPKRIEQPRTKSSLHRKVLELVKEIYPHMTVWEEVPVGLNVGGKPSTLFVDIVVKELNLAIECQGQQHFKFTPRFHDTRIEFGKSICRDTAKNQALLDAGYFYLAIRFDEEKGLTRKNLMKKIAKSME